MTSFSLNYPINTTVCHTGLLRLACQFSDAGPDRNNSQLLRNEDGKVSLSVVTARSYPSSREQS